MRPTWPEYFFELASVTSKRATCPRLSVGCVLVKGNRVLSQGYNGALKNCPQCDEVGCKMVEGHCVRSVHAETNAIAQAARHGISVEGADAYLTHQPCHRCELLLRASGIMLIHWQQEYVNR